MSERKVLNKYYPPDFDPRLLPKVKPTGLAAVRQYVIRTMAPFNMQCNTCGEYIYKGKKFNARKETVRGEFFLGLEIYRFYIRCPRCLAEITFKTDLKNCDYAEEHGAKRLFDSERIVHKAVLEAAEEEEKDKTDPMRMLEKRTKMSRFEMEALARLEELKELNQRQSKVNYEQMLEKYRAEEEREAKRQELEDEAFVKSVFRGTDDAAEKVKRILDDDETDDMKPFADGAASTSGWSAASSASWCSPSKRVKGEPKEEPLDEESAAEADKATTRGAPAAAKKSNLRGVDRQRQLLGAGGIVRLRRKGNVGDDAPSTSGAASRPLEGASQQQSAGGGGALNLLGSYSSSDEEED